MRLIGLDLGTKTLGVSITDKTRTITKPLDVIRFDFEDYDKALTELNKIILEYNINEVVLGLPKNMDGSLGFAASRSLKFKKMLEEQGLVVHLEDERLTTKSAEGIVHSNNKNVKDTKHVIDSIASSIILESYLKRIENDNRK